MNPDLGLTPQGCLEVLKGAKCGVERISQSTSVDHRGLGTSVGLYISTHQLFFLICQLLLCLLTGSLAAVCGMGNGTCQNYTWGCSSSTNNLTTDGAYWEMQLMCIKSSYFEIYCAHAAQAGGKESFLSGLESCLGHRLISMRATLIKPRPQTNGCEKYALSNMLIRESEGERNPFCTTMLLGTAKLTRCCEV